MVSGLSRLAVFIVADRGREGNHWRGEVDVVQILGRGGEGEGRLQGIEKHGGPPISDEMGSRRPLRKHASGRQRECEGQCAGARLESKGIDA